METVTGVCQNCKGACTPVWLNKNQLSDKDNVETKQRELEGVVNHFAMKVYQAADDGSRPMVLGPATLWWRRAAHFRVDDLEVSIPELSRNFRTSMR